ncbi:MAG: hypothetical protein IJ667_03260 [Synergistaceae bacterium]|nr:hypothetical protein [Synergistaceae bacterium]
MDLETAGFYSKHGHMLAARREALHPAARPQGFFNLGCLNHGVIRNS